MFHNGGYKLRWKNSHSLGGSGKVGRAEMRLKEQVGIHKTGKQRREMMSFPSYTLSIYTQIENMTQTFFVLNLSSSQGQQCVCLRISTTTKKNLDQKPIRENEGIKRK